jgi:hypothetical protein
MKKNSKVEARLTRQDDQWCVHYYDKRRLFTSREAAIAFCRGRNLSIRAWGDKRAPKLPPSYPDITTKGFVTFPSGGLPSLGKKR